MGACNRCADPTYSLLLGRTPAADRTRGDCRSPIINGLLDELPGSPDGMRGRHHHQNESRRSPCVGAEVVSHLPVVTAAPVRNATFKSADVDGSFWRAGPRTQAPGRNRARTMTD